MHVREGKKGKAVCRSLVVLDQLVHHLPCPPWHVGDTGVWTNSQTGLLLFLRPRSSEAAAMVTRPDTVTGAGEQSLTRRALPSSRNTYCSLFLRAHTQTPQGTCHPPTLQTSFDSLQSLLFSSSQHHHEERSVRLISLSCSLGIGRHQDR